MKAVITVVGKDTVGICASVSNFCAQYEVNIVNISQTVLDNMFCMIMSVDVNNCTLPFGDFAEKIAELGKEKGLVIHAMHEDIFNAMHRI